MNPRSTGRKSTSFPDFQPYLAQRGVNYVRIIRDENLAKIEKALLIIGTGHILGPATLATKLPNTHVEAPATVVAFTGNVESECNAKFAARAKDRPVPATIVPVAGTPLKSIVESPGCNFERP